MNYDLASVSSFVIPLCDWLQEARLYNHQYENIPNNQIMDRVDAVVLYFSMLNVDRFNIMHKFNDIHNNTRHISLPIEVINVPMDDNENDMRKSFEEQANWFTLMYDDPLIPSLQYRYGITSVPHLLVVKTDGTVISTHGILDLDEYGKNALISWIPSSAISKNPRRLYKDLSALDVSSPYLKAVNHEYQRKSHNVPMTTGIMEHYMANETNIARNTQA